MLVVSGTEPPLCYFPAPNEPLVVPVIVRKYGRMEGVTTRECVTGKGESIKRRSSLGHVPVADTPILM